MHIASGNDTAHHTTSIVVYIHVYIILFIDVHR
jgi:hypothetical protein